MPSTREAVIETWKHLSRDGCSIILDRPEKEWTPEEMVETGRTEAAAVVAEAKSLGLTSFGRVLDFGCGVGRMAHHFASHFDRADGVEPSRDFRLLAWKHAGNAAYFECVFPTMGSFDFIFSHLVFIHHEFEGIAEDLRSLAALLKPGGLMRFDVMTTPDHEEATADAWRIAENAAGPRMSVVGAVYRPDLVRLLAELRLEVLTVDERPFLDRLYEIFWVRRPANT